MWTTGLAAFFGLSTPIPTTASELLTRNVRAMGYRDGSKERPARREDRDDLCRIEAENAGMGGKSKRKAHH